MTADRCRASSPSPPPPRPSTDTDRTQVRAHARSVAIAVTVPYITAAICNRSPRASARQVRHTRLPSHAVRRPPLSSLIPLTRSRDAALRSRRPLTICPPNAARVGEWCRGDGACARARTRVCVSACVHSSVACAVRARCARDCGRALLRRVPSGRIVTPPSHPAFSLPPFSLAPSVLRPSSVCHSASLFLSFSLT